MAMEINSSSVLAKLMGLDRLSSSKAADGRRRVLSVNYLQNVASVGHKEKSLSDLDISMDGDDHLYIEEMAEFSEGSCVDDNKFLLSANGNAGRNTGAGGSYMKYNLEEKSFLSQESRSEQFELRGNLSSSLGHLAVRVSSQASAKGKFKYGKAQSQKPQPHYSFGYRSYKQTSLREQREVTDECYSPPERIMELPVQNERSYVSGRAFWSPGYSSDGTKQKSSYVGKKAVGFQQKRTNSLRYGVDSVIQGSGSPLSKGIAEQVTSQVKQSAWHSCIEASRSRPRSGESHASEHEGTILASPCLSDSVKKCQAPSSSPAKLSDLGECRKRKKQHLESCRVRKFSQEPRNFRAKKFQDQMLSHLMNYVLGSSGKDSSASVTNMNYWEAGLARYLSKPTLFPSAWVPKSKARKFTLDGGWCLRPGERNSKVVKKSLQENISDAGAAATFESSSSIKDLENHNIREEAPSISNDSHRLEGQNTSEGVVASCESFSFKSAFSDMESPTYQETCLTLNETVNDHHKKDVSQDSFLVSLSPTSKSPFVGVEAKEIILEPLNEMDVSELQLEQSPVEFITSILLDDEAPNQQDFVSTFGLKACAPESPVSSLEGPEACRRCLHLAVESKDNNSARECLGNDFLGLQKKLHLIETMSLESGSEPRMVVSSDEDDEIGSVDHYREDAQITECTPENLDYAYLVDVLVESGILMENLGMDSQTWCSRDDVKSYIFNTLEKKYGKASITERSGRRLLFDRINSGLQEIFRGSVEIDTWRKPVVKRLAARRTHVYIEEELWDLLVNQELECKKEISDNVCRREMGWLDLGEELDPIAQEIQSLLIDELTEEFVTTEMSFSESVSVSR